MPLRKKECKMKKMGGDPIGGGMMGGGMMGGGMMGGGMMGGGMMGGGMNDQWSPLASKNEEAKKG